MINKRTCPICGAVFEPDAPRQKYCSTACRKAGTAATRAAWINKAGHREKDRQRHREKRARARQARADQAAESRELLLREKRASGNSSPKYWGLFAAAEIADAEKAGKVSKTTVNGISVYADSFGADVAESIQEYRHVIIKA